MGRGGSSVQTQTCLYACTQAHTPVKAATFFFFLFRREGEGAEEAWHVRSNLLSTVARSPVPVIWTLGQTLGTKLAAGRGRSTA